MTTLELGQNPLCVKPASITNTQRIKKGRGGGRGGRLTRIGMTMGSALPIHLFILIFIYPILSYLILSIFFKFYYSVIFFVFFCWLYILVFLFFLLLHPYNPHPLLLPPPPPPPSPTCNSSHLPSFVLPILCSHCPPLLFSISVFQLSHFYLPSSLLLLPLYHIALLSYVTLDTLLFASHSISSSSSSSSSSQSPFPLPPPIFYTLLLYWLSPPSPPLYHMTHLHISIMLLLLLLFLLLLVPLLLWLHDYYTLSHAHKALS